MTPPTPSPPAFSRPSTGSWSGWCWSWYAVDFPRSRYVWRTCKMVRSIKRAVGRTGGQAVSTALATAALLTARPPDRLTAQSARVEELAARFSAFTAVFGSEQTVPASPLALLPRRRQGPPGHVGLTLRPRSAPPGPGWLV